ncbi:MAG TPA: hypothetical protein VMT94_06670 [Burkholderiales bacterium]|nr:hypothetical protein [Burkholderiales bacterium]
MKKSIIVVLSVIATACALPQYQTRLVPITSNPSVNEEQAAAICVPQAQLAKTNAETNAQAMINNRNNQVTGYNCNTTGYSAAGSYSGNTNCTPQTAGQYRGFAGGFNDAMEVNNAGAQTGAAVLQSCLATYGYRVEKYCVQNCR